MRLRQRNLAKGLERNLKIKPRIIGRIRIVQEYFRKVDKFASKIIAERNTILKRIEKCKNNEQLEELKRSIRTHKETLKKLNEEGANLYEGFNHSPQTIELDAMEKRSYVLHKAASEMQFMIGCIEHEEITRSQIGK